MKNKTWLIASLSATGILLLTGCTVGDVEELHNNRSNLKDTHYAWMMVDIYRGQPVDLCGLPLRDLPEKPDEEKAFEWLKTAADIGDAKACFEVGKIYAQGLNVTQDDKLAAKYFLASLPNDPRDDNEYTVKVCEYLVENHKDAKIYHNVLNWTLHAMCHGTYTPRDEYRQQGRLLTDKYIEDVLAWEDPSDKRELGNSAKCNLLTMFSLFGNTSAKEYTNNAWNEARKAQKKAKEEEAKKLFQEKLLASFYSGSNKISFVGDITSGVAYSVNQEEKIANTMSWPSAEDQKFCLGYITKSPDYKIYWGCVNEKTFTNGSKSQYFTPEAYAFALIRSFNGVTMDEVVEAAQKKYPGLKRTDKRLRAEAIIRGTVYKAIYTLPQVILENDKMKVVIQQIDSVSLPDAVVQRMESGEELYKQSLKDGETYAVKAQDAVDWFQASQKVTDPAAVAFIEQKRSAKDLAEQLKKYGYVKDLYTGSNNSFYKEYADKFSRAKLIPMFSVPKTLENRMILQNDISNDSNVSSIISAAFDNAFSQYFDNVTKGGTNQFVMTIYDKAMWELVKQYYIKHLQKEKEKEKEEKRKKLSL